MTWQLAPCLEVLRNEVNAAWPERSKASDGTIGNADHSSRTSDHNPDANGWVDAMDLTHDPTRGADMGLLVDWIVAGQDHRISYIIWDGEIIRSYKSHDGHPEPWTPEPYRGPNPHTRHAHFSVLDRYRHLDHSWDVAGLDDSEGEDTLMHAVVHVVACQQAFMDGATNPVGVAHWVRDMRAGKIDDQGVYRAHRDAWAQGASPEDRKAAGLE